VVSKFVYTTRANVPDYMVKGGVTYRFVTDHLGSIRLVVDQQTGSVAQRLDYDEWGQVLQNTNPGFQPFGFGGGLYDEQTGLARFGARDYDSQTGRWLSKDPIGLGGGDPNLYAFVFNDPINGRDPSGLWSLGDLLTPARVNGIAGFGDALLFGFGDDLRSLFGIENVDQCSEEYRRGNRIGAGAMLLTGGGRLAYAGLAKGIPLIAGEATEEAARWALNARNSLKIIFRLGLDRTSRIVDLAALELKYGPGNWTAIIEAAGRTSATWNAGGAAGVLGGAAALLGGPDCGCKP
jgi:RHS repeat-associated protein